jgi:hypothetical protein
VLQSLLLQSSAASNAAAAAGSAGRQLQLEVLQMPDDALVNRIVAQTAAQPGELHRSNSQYLQIDSGLLLVRVSAA